MSTRNSSGMPKITSLDSFTESINMLVYADPGTGKTVLGGTASNALIVATEPGTIAAKIQGSKADLAACHNWKQFYELVRWGRRGGDKKHDWWVIDTLTEAGSMCIRDILDDGVKENSSRNLDAMQIQDYGIYQNRFKRVVKALNDMPMNILYLCHSMNEEDEEGEPIVLPDLYGKNGTNDATTMSRWVCGTQHVYGYLKVVHKEKKEIRRLICKRSGPYLGKDRYDCLLPYVDNPNMTEIDKRIHDKMEKVKISA